MIRKIFSYCFITTLINFSILFSPGCNQNKIIDEEKFIQVYTDIIFASDTISEKSLSKDEIINRVLANHKVTLDDYKSTVQYYNQQSERWEKFFSKAITYLDEKRRKAEK